MRRQIDLLDKHYTITVPGHSGERYVQIENNVPEPAALNKKKDFCHTIKLGNQEAEIHLAAKGESVFIRAFGRTFNLNIINPVDMAAQESGSSANMAKAPMPGTIVSINVAEKESLKKAQAMVTIESMKILTVITSPRDGEVEKIHFEPGDTFDKNATLVTLKDIEEK